MDESYRVKTAPAYQVKTPTDDGIVEQIVSVYGNVDSYGERILLGFFDDSIAAHNQEDFVIAGLYSHDRLKPIASTKQIMSLPPYDSSLPNKIKDKGGLYIKGEYNLDTQIGAETFSNIKKKILNQYSVGITVKEDRRDASDVIDLIRGKLWEWSAVLWGANDLTTTLGVKQAYTAEKLVDMARVAGISPKQFEKWLEGYVDMKLKEGRKLSSATVSELRSNSQDIRGAAQGMIATADNIDALIESAAPSSDKALMLMAQAKHIYATANI